MANGFDTVILGGKVLDGTGTEPYRADVGIIGERIGEIGDLGSRKARRSIGAEGRLISPGFIDIHSHDDFNLPVNPLAAGKTRQGVTTVVAGNCGFSPAPVVKGRKMMLKGVVSFLDSGLDYNWRSFAEYMESLPAAGVNLVQLAGHVTVRCGAMGLDDRPPRKNELERMQALVVEAMEAGAFGLSTGLIYPPSSYAGEEEIHKLAAIVARYGGGYFTHIRDEADGVLESIEEAIHVGRSTGVYVQISHLKAAHPRNWGKAEAMLSIIDRARREGIVLACDQYPYTAASTGMDTLLPDWVRTGGKNLAASLEEPSTKEKVRRELDESMKRGTGRLAEWKDARISSSPSRPALAGLDLAEAARAEGKTPAENLLDLLIADQGRTLGTFFVMGEEDMFRILRHPAVAIGSDGIYTGTPADPEGSKPHPRYFGAFPRVLGRYTREGRLPSLPEAVRKMTSLPADILGLRDRGRIRVGLAADLTIFDPKTINDEATYEEPHLPPTGIPTVLVNGTPVVENGKVTGATPGKVLRRKG